MTDAKTTVVKKSLFAWIFSGNFKLQLILLVTIVVSVIVRVFPLEMQKRIINQAIQLKAFELLLIYCSFYLAAVMLASGLKYVISYLQTVIGQRAGKNMRSDLYRYILTLPLGFFRKTQPGMVVQSLSAELATAGDFIGMAVGIPVTSVLTLLGLGGYLLWLNPLLAMVSFTIYPLAILIVPILQKRANAENKKRVDAARDLSSKIAEAVSGIHEIQANGAHYIEARKFDSLAKRLMDIRIVWHLYRQAIKVGNNFFTNLGPFLIFILGGYLTIQGRLELGALVAFLSAQEKLYDPWRELIDFYQAYQEASVSYRRTMEYFDAAPEFALEPVSRKPYQLEGKIEVKDLSYTVDARIKLLDDIDFSVAPGEQVALVGFSGSGKSTLALCIGQLFKYTAGRVLIDNHEVVDLSKRDIAQNIGLVSQTPFIFDGTIEENLLYSCLAQKEGNGSAQDRALPDLDEMIEIIQQTGIFPDVLRFGLNAVLDSTRYLNLVPNLIRVRKKLARRLSAPLAEHVEFFDKEKFLYYSTAAKNITFGSANQDAYKEDNLSKNEYFLKFLDEIKITKPLLDLGTDLCQKTIDILGNLAGDETFFEQSPITADELDKYKVLLEKLKISDTQMLPAGERQKLLELALRFIPAKHKMVALSNPLRAKILDARTRFREKISVDAPGVYSFYRRSDYIYSHTILNNIFFGRMKTQDHKAQDDINEQIVQLLVEEDLLENVVKIGLQFQVGSKGDRLSGGQRQKLAIARAFLKKPKILIMDEATSALDNQSQTRIQSLLDTHWKRKSTLIAVVHRLDIIKGYDKIGVMKSGKIEEMGSYDELMAKKGLLYELATGRK
ncbi:MAG: ABC transporter ATP-binding protein/permease [Desulfobacterales bacterium]|jgi:ABC-type multidrug transport system fused ATPase/permease subunit